MACNLLEFQCKFSLAILVPISIIPPPLELPSCQTRNGELSMVRPGPELFSGPIDEEVRRT